MTVGYAECYRATDHDWSQYIDGWSYMGCCDCGLIHHVDRRVKWSWKRFKWIVEERWAREGLMTEKERIECSYECRPA